MEITRQVLVTSLLSLIGSSLLSYFLVLFFKRLALKTGIVDKPRGDRFHQEPVPLMGGNAIYLTFLIFLVVRDLIEVWFGLAMLAGVVFLLYGIIRKPGRMFLFFGLAVAWCSLWGLAATDGVGDQILGLLVGGTILMMVGNVDDARGGIIPHIKVLGQTIAGFFLIYCGIKVNFFVDLGYDLGFQWIKWLSSPFTLFWIIGMTNAFNLIDNMNGLSCGVAVISSFFFGLISFVNGQVPLGTIFFIFMGAGIGYLPHNFPRAKIFMGDTGSLFIGFVIAGLSIVGSWSTAAGWTSGPLKLSLAIPLLVLIYPIFDTVLVMVTRFMRGRPISLGGKDHSSHRLVRLGLQPADTVLLIYTFSSFAGFCALFLTIIGYEQALLMLAFLFLFIFLVGLRLGKIAVDG
ncbi:MAG: hypothetical protein A2Z86_11330 [Candidatus Glassbacteria bacterium GWA2_58_10]|uniref:Undecaprenyl-phosphate alpha-N-acetylglucosaminyl 1-phosphate transferase n=1 Tax=Candidatus Glassbacteria bacterium GWA2_58_10 TaxID=1817865 RepID=A0A1F5YJ87_9BACT|nr:MAG: hypothetical protein A2Z86_11330 [Candidatus Glassbacteria bacterium GWA2_58_10]